MSSYQEERTDDGCRVVLLRDAHRVWQRSIVHRCTVCYRWTNGQRWEARRRELTGKRKADWVYRESERLRTELRSALEVLRCPPMFKCGITMSVSRRHLVNSEGCNVSWQETWFDVVAGHMPLRIYASDGCSDVGRALTLLRSCIETVADRVDIGQVSCGSGHDRYSLVLRPAVSAVLLHELFCHGLEEHGCDAVTTHKLPFVLRLWHPRDPSVDDEGIATTSVEIDLTRRSFQRFEPRSSIDGCHGSGFAQAAVHGMEPRVRLTHMAARPDSSLPVVQPGDAVVVCSEPGDGWYRDGRAVVKVNLATRRRLKLSPFYFSVTLAEMRELLIGWTNVISWGRSGICTKGQDHRPVMGLAPELVLNSVEVW